MSGQINRDRREFLQAAALGVTPAPLVLSSPSDAQSAAPQSFSEVVLEAARMRAARTDTGIVHCASAFRAPLI